MTEPTKLAAKSHKKLVMKLVLFLVFMSGFSFALVPLYDVFCNVFGINGKTGNISLEQSLAYKADESRTLDISFVGTIARGLPISFRPMIEELPEVKPGKFYTINYEVKNLSNEQIIARAVPSVSPNQASLYFKKLYCFCFADQVFQSGETRIMPLRFVIEPEIPKSVNDITLSYTFFKSIDQQKNL